MTKTKQQLVDEVFEELLVAFRRVLCETPLQGITVTYIVSGMVMEDYVSRQLKVEVSMEGK